MLAEISATSNIGAHITLPCVLGDFDETSVGIGKLLCRSARLNCTQTSRVWWIGHTLTKGIGTRQKTAKQTWKTSLSTPS